MISPPTADGLNEKQQQSVTLSEDINALILAGAGSGKTRVLTHRIHYLVSEKNHHPFRLPVSGGFQWLRNQEYGNRTWSGELPACRLAES